MCDSKILWHHDRWVESANRITDEAEKVGEEVVEEEVAILDEGSISRLFPEDDILDKELPELCFIPEEVGALDEVVEPTLLFW